MAAAFAASIEFGFAWVGDGVFGATTLTTKLTDKAEASPHWSGCSTLGVYFPVVE